VPAPPDILANARRGHPPFPRRERGRRRDFDGTAVRPERTNSVRFHREEYFDTIGNMQSGALNPHSGRLGVLFYLTVQHRAFFSFGGIIFVMCSS